MRVASGSLLFPDFSRVDLPAANGKKYDFKAMPYTRFQLCLVTSLLTALSFTPVSAAPAPKAPVKSISAQLQPFVDDHTLAGAVTLVANKDEILTVQAVGFADIAAKKLIRPDDLFWIASMSKAMTAAALMILVDEGKVNVDDPVEKYLPEFKGQMVIAEKDNDHVLLKKPTHPITVKNILTHTSGLPFKSPMEQPTLDVLTLRDGVRSYAMGPLEFQPDTKYQYSNAGINTAGRIIEVVSGMPYETFLDKRLLQPLGMKDTTFWPSPAQLKRLAKSYKPNKEKTGLEETTVTQLKYPLNDRARQPMPAGGLFSTAVDTAHFCQMLLNGGTWHGKRILSEASVKQMTSNQTGDLPQAYGFGLSADKKPGGPYGHGGAYSTNMHIDPERGLITVFMVQHAGWPNDGGKKVQPTFQKAAQEAFGK